MSLLNLMYLATERNSLKRTAPYMTSPSSSDNILAWQDHMIACIEVGKIVWKNRGNFKFLIINKGQISRVKKLKMSMGMTVKGK